MSLPRWPWTRPLPLRPQLLAGLLASLLTTAAWAQSPGAAVGEVAAVQGVGLVQTPGQPARILSQGSALREGDRLSTASDALLLLALRDGTRLTVRPDTELVVTQYRYSQGRDDNAMLLNLIKGGLRALTGLISKSGAPGNARIQTATATIGIRGTDFDVRLCQSDCSTEAQARGDAPPRAVPRQVSARLLLLQGPATVLATGTHPARRLSHGAALYNDDTLETGPGTQAVLAFRDDSRVTLGPATRFKINQFSFDADQPHNGRFGVALLKGTLRAITGLIGKANPRNVSFTTPTATIGIRGTGFDLSAPDDQQDGHPPRLQASTWLGSVVVSPQNGGDAQVLNSGEGLRIDQQGQTRLNDLPPAPGPRPDSLPIPPQTFGTQYVSDTEDGLFVNVRDGDVELSTAQGSLLLGRDEVGVVKRNGTLARATTLPRFVEHDTTPHPSTQRFNAQGVLNQTELSKEALCP